MIQIKEVKSHKDSRLFTEFPNKLYRACAPYVPPLSMDERSIFSYKSNPVHEYADSVRFLAFKDKKVVGRIGGIVNHRINDHYKKKQARFTRIDMIDDLEVTKALINAVSLWAKEKFQCNELIGPIGFTDLDRQGMLVEGFDELNMFITIYNYPYYKDHLEQLGFVKDADWVEKKIMWPSSVPDKVKRGSEISQRRYGFKLIKVTKRRDIKKYAYDAFKVYNVAFSKLYGFFPITDKVMDYYIKQFIAFVRLDLLWFVVDKNDQIAGFTIIMPSLAQAVKKSNGKILPFGIFRIFRALKKADIMDLYFIAIAPEHQGKGVIAIMWEDGIEVGIQRKIRFAETGPELENNLNIINQWKDFDTVQHKRRRCYIKQI